MKPIEEVYPEAISDTGIFWGESNYIPLLESLGYEISIRIDDDDYQGDSRLLFQDAASYGLLIFGWGSCSGCDALQACDSYEEMESLRQKLSNEIHWEPTGKAMSAWIENKDWELEYSWHTARTKTFVEKCLLYLHPSTPNGLASTS